MQPNDILSQAILTSFEGDPFLYGITLGILLSGVGFWLGSKLTPAQQRLPRQRPQKQKRRDAMR